MAIEKEIWISDIQENLFAGNEFVKKGVDHSQWISNKTVHVPQAGANPTVVKNRASFPASVAQRTDADLTYSMAEFTTSPIAVRDLEELQVNYGKRMSVMKQHIDALSDAIGNNAAYSWAPAGAGTFVKTTGTATSNALAPSATTTRLAITLADILKAKAILDFQNIPQSGRILLMPSDMYNAQLMAIPDAYQAQSYGQSALPSGVISRMFGFDIMIRPSVVVYDNSATPALKAVNDLGVPSSPAVTDNLACLAFHPSFVCQAVGDTKVFYEENSPLWYGNILDALQMFGAAKLRTDQKGIVSIVQAN